MAAKSKVINEGITHVEFVEDAASFKLIPNARDPKFYRDRPEIKAYLRWKAQEAKKKKAKEAKKKKRK